MGPSAPLSLATPALVRSSAYAAGRPSTEDRDMEARRSGTFNETFGRNNQEATARACQAVAMLMGVIRPYHSPTMYSIFPDIKYCLKSVPSAAYSWGRRYMSAGTATRRSVRSSKYLAKTPRSASECLCRPMACVHSLYCAEPLLVLAERYKTWLRSAQRMQLCEDLRGVYDHHRVETFLQGFKQAFLFQGISQAPDNVVMLPQHVFLHTQREDPCLCREAHAHVATESGEGKAVPPGCRRSRPWRRTRPRRPGR